MSFKTFKARRITLTEAKESDFKEYKRQADGYKLNNEKKMNTKKHGYYLAVYEPNENLIGLIHVYEKENVANVDISIPNKCKEVKYGKETLHQFIKCCLERKMYEYISLDENSWVADAYRAERPERFEKEEYIINLKKLLK